MKVDLSARTVERIKKFEEMYQGSHTDFEWAALKNQAMKTCNALALDLSAAELNNRGNA